MYPCRHCFSALGAAGSAAAQTFNAAERRPLVFSSNLNPNQQINGEQ